MKHLFKKHEGESIEVEGYWIHGTGPAPDELFHPQFASTPEDYTRCKGKGKAKTKSKGQPE